MLLPHPKYKGSFIALPAPSFSSKLIASETWMTLESEAPLTPLLGFSEERFPSPDTVPALSQRGGRGAGLCRARCGCTAQCTASLAPGHVGPLPCGVSSTRIRLPDTRAALQVVRLTRSALAGPAGVPR